MRRSPLLHPLAVLRITAGLTQQQMGDLVDRAARTIQSIELQKLPLTEELALRIAEATGVDEAWLFAGDPQSPPRKGMTLIQAGRGHEDYTRADYEFHRAYVETPVVTKEELVAAIDQAKAKGSNDVEVSALGLHKSAVLKKQQAIINLIDRDLVNQLRFILAQTETSDDMRLVRWKIRRYFEDLAREFSLEIGKTGISIKSLEMANPKAPAKAKSVQPVRNPSRRSKH